MGRYSRLLAGVFPGYAINRAKALQVVNAYDAEKKTRTFNKRGEARGPNASTRTAPKNIRQIVREMEQNYDFVSGALDILCTNIVGNGLVPEPMVLTKKGEPHKEVNDFLADQHYQWAKRPEVTWLEDETSAQHLMCRTWMRDGAVLAQHIVGERTALDHGTKIPYSYEMIEPDLLVTDARQFPGRKDIIDGIELNGWRRPVGFHLWKFDPNDSTQYSHALTEKDRKRISAENMTYLHHASRINQINGVSKFASAIKRIYDINEIDETERIAARVAAAMAAFVIKGDPADYDTDAEEKERHFQMRPGMVFDDLVPGETVQSLDSKRPNNALIPFRGSQLRAGASGIGISYSSWSKDYNGTYSSQRQELVEQHQMYTPAWSKYVCRLELPKYQRFVQAVQLSGWRPPRDVDMATLQDSIFTQPAMPWINPVQEAEGYGKLVEYGFDAQTNVIRARGGNPRDVRRQRKIDHENEDPTPVVPNKGNQPEKPGS